LNGRSFKPVVIGKITIARIAAAAEFLATGWPAAAKGSTSHREALRTCMAAYRGEVGLEEVRLTLITATSGGLAGGVVNGLRSHSLRPGPGNAALEPM